MGGAVELNEALTILETGPVYRLATLTDNDAPTKGPPGVYTLWHDEGTFLYAGMAYRDASETSNPQAAGVWGRLKTHAGARRSGYLNTQILDRFVIPDLSRDDLEQLRRGELALRERLRAFLHEHVGYRVWIAPDGDGARLVEDHLRSRGLPAAGRPLLNPK